MYPNDLRYNEEHTWLRLEGDELGRVGITHYAQERLREVVFIELPEVGDKVSYMEPFGVIESVKATNDVYSPVSGEIIEVNGALVREPGLVNEDPYGKGWMLVVRIMNTGELNNLLSPEEYRKLVNGESLK
jgi:glycine cleavage system H protein